MPEEKPPDTSPPSDEDKEREEFFAELDKRGRASFEKWLDEWVAAAPVEEPPHENPPEPPKPTGRELREQGAGSGYWRRASGILYGKRRAAK